MRATEKAERKIETFLRKLALFGSPCLPINHRLSTINISEGN
jgi:hypothetical protein